MNLPDNNSDGHKVKMWRNPATGKETTIPAQKVLKFRASNTDKGRMDNTEAKRIVESPEKIKAKKK